jgi:signal transduction histidine kinase/CheY-like chemotaxis protein
MSWADKMRAWRRRIWVGYGLALALPLLALGLRFALGNALVGFPFLTFFPAVLVAAVLGGIGPGLAATLASALLAHFYLIEPLGSLLPTDSSGWIGLVLFGLVCATIIVLLESLNRALDRLADTTDALQSLNLKLEARVSERTNELATTNEQLRSEMKAREDAEARIRQAQKMEALGQLTGGIAHDFNNMLAIIIGSLDLAKRRLVRGGPDAVTFIDNAMDGARRGAVLTQRLLAFSRQQPLKPAVTDVNTLVRGMEDLLRRTLGEAIEVEFVLGAGLWPTLVDSGQLENAILNLVLNARDAMPTGGQMTVETLNAHLDETYAERAEVDPGQYIAIAVTDTGVGMSPSVAKRAFDPFFTTKGVGQGTGLGLSQVHGFVRQSGGHVKIYSEPGQGTTVRIYLRREFSKPAAKPIDGGRPVLSELLPRGTPEEIVLVVEDEDAVRRSTVDAVRELGYTVRHASSGEQALAILAEQPGVKLLFTDVVMPGMSGRKLTDVALSRRPDLKVLYTTGYTPNAIIHHGVADRGVNLLTKPFGLDQVARKLRKVLDAS